jgi:hypothetical protein
LLRRCSPRLQISRLHIENPVAFLVNTGAAWHTDHPTPDVACRFFDPQRFEVPADGVFTGTALEVSIEASGYEEVGSSPVKFEKSIEKPRTGFVHPLQRSSSALQELSLGSR